MKSQQALILLKFPYCVNSLNDESKAVFVRKWFQHLIMQTTEVIH